ncbi:MAG: NAD(P)/FAD-dependent oxidoreductase [Candidatus Omnitrophota bacterium]
MQEYNIAVVGGGPAGMMAAISAGQLYKDVVLVEKNNSLGKKLLLTGKGRCNLTNIGGLDRFLGNYENDAEFLRDAFSVFFNEQLMAFFENKGLKLKVERQGRVFPQTDNAEDVLKILRSALMENKVKIIYNSPLSGLKRENDKFTLTLAGPIKIEARLLILATGGASFPQTGSTADGFRIAQGLGHRIVRLRPALVPLETKDAWVKHLQGLTLKNIRIHILGAKKKISSEIGDLLFTHFGVSGPLILGLSAKIVDLLEKGGVKISIDLKPGLPKEKLEERLIRDLREQGNSNFQTILKGLLPNKLISVFLKLLNIAPNKKANQITSAERINLLRLLKDFLVTVLRSRPLSEAMVTRGGLDIRQINPRTMESRLIKGLYFCGEIIDVSGSSGGYNLQAAFSTGYLAGQAAAKSS